MHSPSVMMTWQVSPSYCHCDCYCFLPPLWLQSNVTQKLAGQKGLIWLMIWVLKTYWGSAKNSKERITEYFDVHDYILHEWNGRMENLLVARSLPLWSPLYSDLNPLTFLLRFDFAILVTVAIYYTARHSWPYFMHTLISVAFSHPQFTRFVLSSKRKLNWNPKIDRLFVKVVYLCEMDSAESICCRIVELSLSWA